MMTDGVPSFLIFFGSGGHSARGVSEECGRRGRDVRFWMNDGRVVRSRASVHCLVDMMNPATIPRQRKPHRGREDSRGILKSANSISDAFGNASFRLSNSHSSSCATVIADGWRASASLTLR
jgi:hypothetical protein